MRLLLLPMRLLLLPRLLRPLQLGHLLLTLLLL